jgi:hypothetical protein
MSKQSLVRVAVFMGTLAVPLLVQSAALADPGDHHNQYQRWDNRQDNRSYDNRNRDDRARYDSYDRNQWNRDNGRQWNRDDRSRWDRNNRNDRNQWNRDYRDRH